MRVQEATAKSSSHVIICFSLLEKDQGTASPLSDCNRNGRLPSFHPGRCKMLYTGTASNSSSTMEALSKKVVQRASSGELDTDFAKCHIGCIDLLELGRLTATEVAGMVGRNTSRNHLDNISKLCLAYVRPNVTLELMCRFYG